MYISITEYNHKSKKATSIDKNVVDDELKHEDYKDVLFNRSYMKHEINRIQSKDHTIGSHTINKVSLSCYDDEKFILKSGYIRLSHIRKCTC